MKYQIREKGITLIALIITIIILLILAGVTISSALGENGLFKVAKTAGEKYKEAEQQEGKELENIEKEMDKIAIDYNKYVGVYVDYEPDEGSCEIKNISSGIDDTNPQKFSTESDIKWRIWDYDGETIRLISDKITSQKLKIKGINGYNNGVWALNEICRKCYGKNINGVSASSIKTSDIQKVTKYDYTQYSHNSTIEDQNGKGQFKYGSKKSYSNITYPKTFDICDKEWKYEKLEDGSVINENEKEGLLMEKDATKEGNIDGTSNGNIDLKESHWEHYYNIEKAEEDEWINTKYYDLIFKNGNGQYFEAWYWLARRSVSIFENVYSFSIDTIGCLTSRAGAFGTCKTNLYTTGGEGTTTYEISFRPMVSINLRTSGYSLEKIEENGKIKFELVGNEEKN